MHNLKEYVRRVVARADLAVMRDRAAGYTLPRSLIQALASTYHDLGLEDEQDVADVIKATKDYTPGEGISVLETHERMREEGKL